MNQFAIVTGAGKGIGRAIALMLAQQNMFVVIIGRHLQSLQEVQSFFPNQIHIIQADIATEEGRKQLLTQLPADVEIKFLIHNAGSILPIKSIMQLTYDEWRKNLAINLDAPLFLTQALLPKIKRGRVLHISSGAAHRALKGWLAYCASKAALHMLYRCFKEELTNDTVSFGSIRPGLVDTQLQADIRDASNPFDNREYYSNIKEKGELLSPEEVALFIKWLLFSVNEEEFGKEEWDIRDTKHHAFWKG